LRHSLENRVGDCFLGRENEISDLKPFCYEGGTNWNTYQVTASGCPPYLNLEGTGTCAELRRFIFNDLLDNYQYDIVLLGGIHSNAYFMEDKNINYAFLGPRPSFEERPTVLIRNHGKTEGLETFMQSNLARSPEISFPLSERNYYSTNNALCDDDNNCKWYSNNKLFYKDAVHFSVDGSYYVGEALSKWIKDNY